MNLCKKFLAVGAVAVLGVAATNAYADGPRERDHPESKDACVPDVLASSVQATPAVTKVSGICLDLADAVSTSGPPTTKAVKVEAWVDGAFVPLTPGAAKGNVYTKNGTTNVLETIAVCSAHDAGDGITTLRITRPYLAKDGKARSTTEASSVAVAFKGGC